MGRRTRLVAAGAALALLGTALGGCGTDGDGSDSAEPDGNGPDTAAESDDSQAAPEEVDTYEQPGPYAVEQLTVTVDGPEGSVDVRVWAPTPGEGAGEPGPWPLLVYAHGLGLTAADHDRELAHAASWGFVTAANEQTKDVDLVELADGLWELAGEPQSPLAGRVDAGEPLVVGGMSQGTGYAATSAASSPDDVAGALLVSGGGAPAADGTGTVPTMILGGGRDPAVSTWMEPGFDAAQGPVTLVLVDQAGHSSFSSGCTSEARQSMVGANPQDCAPPEVGEEALWPAIDHTIVAFLRWATGQDTSAVALSGAVIGSLGVEVTVRGDLDAG